MPTVRLILVVLPLLAALLLPGCASSDSPEYARPLPPGMAALRKVPREQWPDMMPAIRNADGSLTRTLDRSVEWFGKDSTKQFFPMEGVTHEHAMASAFALREVLGGAGGAVPGPGGPGLGGIEQSTNAMQRIEQEFDLYESVGWNGEGVVLFTAYYSPIFQASKQRTAQYQYPLYRKPPDLAVNPATGEVLGRDRGGQITPYPTRAQIEHYPDRLGLAGRELVWMKDKLDRFIIHVNGSARLQMTDGSTMDIGYSATNGLQYTSIGKLLVADGRIPRDKISLPAIQTYFEQNPDHIDRYVMQNDRYVFFEQYTSGEWPAGSLGFTIEPMRSVATDKTIFPRGCPTLVLTTLPDASGAPNARPVAFTQFMADQDTGGAIRSAGRADLYLGVGARAGWIAGRQAAEGRLYYLLLKPQRVAGWARRAAEHKSTRTADAARR